MKLFEQRRPIVTVLDRAIDETRIVLNWSRIEQKQQQRAALRQRLPMVAAAVVITTVGFVVGYVLRSEETVVSNQPLSLENQPMIPVLAVPSGSVADQQVVLSDGSKLTVAPGATLEILENTGVRFKTILRDGWVRFNVVPYRERSWIIDAGIAEVRVVGTQFTVSRAHHRVTVSVHRGVVQVRPIPFEGALEELCAGESKTWGAGSKTIEVAPEALTDGSPADAETSAGKAPAQSHARGARAKAVQPFTPAPVSLLSGLGASKAVNDRLDAIDRARKQGHHRQAATLLSSLIEAFPDDPVVGLAALTLARIRLQNLNRPRAAAEAYRFASDAKTLPGSLREQAAARSVQAYRRAGDTASARTMRDRYKRRYPNGAWMKMVEQWGADTE